MRKTFVQTLCHYAERDRRIWLLTGDLGFSVLEPFQQEFPDRFINVGVAEQNMTGVAAGLAMSGKIVFTYSIGNFPSLRPLEQIRNDVCYHNANVKIVSVGAGLAYGAQGYTHHGIEDAAILRTLPNMSVVTPADAYETVGAMEAILQHTGPAYLRLGKTGKSAIHHYMPVMERGKIIPIHPGREILLIGTGNIMACVLRAAQSLETEGIFPSVWSCPWLKPFDYESIQNAAKEYDWIVTVEEAQITGGLGSAVAEVLAELPDSRARLQRLGIKDTIVKEVAGQARLRSILQLDSQGIARQVQSVLEGILWPKTR